MRIINRVKHSHKIHVLLIQTFFVLLAIAFTAYSSYLNRITSLNDMVFNYQRVIEVFKQVLHFQLPQYGLYTALPVGNDLETLYPWLIFAPLAPLLLIIHNPLILWNTVLSIFMLIGLEISYFSCKSITHKKFESMLFSVAYCVSTIEIGYVLAYADIGAYIGMLLVPLAFFGWIHWLKNGNWKMMVTGLTLILYSHIVTTAITIVSLVILTLLFWFDKDINNRKYKVFQLLKSIGTFFLTTCFIWLPAVILFKTNRLAAPSTKLIGMNKMVQIIPTNLSYFVAPYLYRVWTFTDLACLVLVVIYWKKLSWTLRKLSLMALGYILINGSWVKFWLILHTPLRQIQFMYRISFFSHLLLSFVLAEIVVKILMKRWYIQNVISLLMTLLVLIVGSIFLTDADIHVVHRWPSSSFNTIYRDTSTHSMDNDIKTNGWMSYVVTNRKTMSMPVYLHMSTHYDYLPLNEAKHFGLTNKGYTSRHHNLDIKHLDNGKIQFHLQKNDRKVMLPVSMYNSQKYHIYLDGKHTNYNYNHKTGTLDLYHIKKGVHVLQVCIPTMMYRYLSLLISFIGWLIIIATYLMDKNRGKNHE